MGRNSNRYEEFFRRIRENVFEFCKAFGWEPTWQQEEVLKIAQLERDLSPTKRKKRIAVKSGQGPGKTEGSVILAKWRTIQYVNALTIVTAPTMRQGKEVWLSTARRLMEKAHPILKKLIRVTKSKIEFGGLHDWAIKLATATKAEALQGFHQEHLTFIADEASGVERDIIEQILGTLTNEDSLFLAIGNPNTQDCAFYDMFNMQRAYWHTFTMNAEESPIVDQENVRRLELQFGRHSDVYRVRVLGEFPYMDPNTVMSAEDLEYCTKTDPYQCALDGGRRRFFGIDFARFGDDESVIYQRTGMCVTDHKVFVKKDPNDVLYEAFRMQRDSSWKNEECWYVADAGGMGQGVMKRFYENYKRVHEFHNGGIPWDPQYGDKITEAYFLFATFARARRLHIPSDNSLIQQLSTRQYFLNRKGKIVLEEKKEYKKRTEFSPDRADAIVMAFYDVVGAEAQMARTGRGKKRVGVALR
jgi:hypothetical protein